MYLTVSLLVLAFAAMSVGVIWAVLIDRVPPGAVEDEEGWP
jgi:hypothetical protein